MKGQFAINCPKYFAHVRSNAYISIKQMYNKQFNKFKKQLRMTQPLSLNGLPNHNQYRLDLQNLPSVPPGCQKYSIAGLLTIKLAIQYLNKPNASVIFRVKFWGNQGEILTLKNDSNNQAILNLNIRSSIEKLSKYLSDMGVLCIQCLTSVRELHKQVDLKPLGWVYINLKRYVINFTMSNFQEVVSIMGQKKNKLGEVIAVMKIDMYQKEVMFPNPTQPQIAQPRHVSIMDQIRPSHDSSPYKAQQRYPLQQNSSVPSSQEERAGERQRVRGRNEQSASNREIEQDYIFGEGRRKGKAQQFLDEYNKNKGEHTQLSLLRQRYGFNCPSIEVMKLKLDQAILLSHHQQQQRTQHSSNIHLLLKWIKNETKTKLEFLLVTFQQNMIKTQTKITISQQQSSNRIDINYLYVLPKIAPQDILTFEIRQGRGEISLGELKRRSSVDLKGKNGKKIAVLQFAIISQKYIEVNSIQGQGEAKGKQKGQVVSRIGDSCLLRVQGWEGEMVKLKNKKIGVVYGGKIIYEPQYEQNIIVQVELQTKQGQIHRLKTHINHLYKEENYLLSGRQVKIISAKGKLTDIIPFASKVDTISKVHNPPQSLDEVKEEQRIDLKDIGGVFQKLQKCNSEECNELMQLLSTKGTNSRYIERLSTLIGVDPSTFSIILKQSFNSDFSLFFKCFMAYHSWNHRYRLSQKKVQKIINGSSYYNQIQKSVKRLKRSSEVLFGMVSSTAFINEFMKYQIQRPITEQTESEFNREELAKLIVLLLERYPIKSIKISELESFFNNVGECFHINAYLLAKMGHQISSNVELFGEFLSEPQWQMIDVFRKDYQGDWGLAKLLLTNQEEMGNQSVLSESSAADRKPTEYNPLEQFPLPIKTELDEPKEIKGQNVILTEQQSNKQRITVIITGISIQGMEGLFGVKEMIIASENQRVNIKNTQIILPKAIELIQELTHTVTIITDVGIFQGVFIGSSRSQRVVLFKNGVEAGSIRLFGQKMENTEEDEIAIRVEDNLSIPMPMRLQQEQVNLEELQAKCMIPVAKSPFVKCTIRSIRPTRSNYKLLIVSEHQRKVLNFPNQNQILLKNSPQWTISMIDENADAVLLSNHLASNPYCFVDAKDKQVAYTAVVEVEECWDGELALGLGESLHLIIHFDHLLSVKEIPEGEYCIIMESNSEIPYIVCQSRGEGKTKMNVGKSIIQQKPLDRYSLKLINRSSKELLAQFEFTLKVIQEGIMQCNRSLISKGFRLQLTIFEIRHSWIYCKPNKILQIFEYQSRRVISSWIRSNSIISQQQLITWLRANTQLTLTQINIILEELIGGNNPVKEFISLFEGKEKLQLPYLTEIRDQFSVFDYNDEGLVSEEQLKIAKKVFNRTFKEFYGLIIKQEQLFTPSPQIRNNFIIDLSTAIKSNLFDYLSLLDLIEQGVSQPKQRPQNTPSIKDELQEGSNLSVRILQFDNLSINRLPCTFLFKINGHILAEPIHKCYSNKYSSSNQIILPRKPTPQLQIYLQTLKSNGLWDYKLLQTIPLTQLVKVFGGFIKFKIEATERSRVEQREATVDQNRDTNSRAQTSKKNQPQSANKQFRKSIWNKSLNDTKQKWSQWKQSRKIQKQVKKEQQCDDNDDD